jgi:hypothetical protein
MVEQHHDVFIKLLQLFPNIDRHWLSILISNYNKSSYSDTELVQHISEKLIDFQHGWYPQTEKDPNALSAKNKYLKDLHSIFPRVDLQFLRNTITMTRSNHGNFLFFQNVKKTLV